MDRVFFFKTSLNHDSDYIKTQRFFFFFYYCCLSKKKSLLLRENGRLIQSTTQDYHNKMIYDSQMGKNKTFFYFKLHYNFYSEDSYYFLKTLLLQTNDLKIQCL